MLIDMGSSETSLCDTCVTESAGNWSNQRSAKRTGVDYGAVVELTDAGVTFHVGLSSCSSMSDRLHMASDIVKKEEVCAHIHPGDEGVNITTWLILNPILIERF
jgi:hypothetical protein